MTRRTLTVGLINLIRNRVRIETLEAKRMGRQFSVYKPTH